MCEKILLIDGHSILNRAFYGLPDLTNSEGLHTGAVYGFLNILFKVLGEEKPEYLAVAFDRSEPTFRHAKYPEYKGTRKPMPQELKEQIPLLKEMLEKLCALNFVKIPLGKQVDVNISCEMDNPEISVDPVYLPIVFENLIGNAIKYSGKSVKIDIRCQGKGKWIEIRVKDNGIGIPSRSLKRIFEIYYRDPSMRDDHSRKGFGIGLSFVHSVVKAHHGKITVHSIINVGTEFIIILPRKQWKRK
mgnify:CR=1 FL=1